MSTFAVYCVVLVTFMFYYSTDAISSIKVDATPTTICPILSKKLQIKCSVRTVADTTTVQPTTTTTKTTTKPTSTTKTTTKAIVATTKAPSATTTTKPTTTQPKSTTVLNAPINSDMTYLLSIVISKQNSVTGKTDTVASVAGRLAANAEVQYLGTVEVQGNTDNSTKSGEQGFLQLTWNYPLEQHGGNYICTASGLNSAKQTVSLSTSVQIVVTQPNISDLVSYISDHDKSLTDLQLQATQQSHSTQVMKLDMEELQANQTKQASEAVDELKSVLVHNVQSGTNVCSENVQYFNVSFNTTPIVYVSVSRFNLSPDSSARYASMNWQVSIQTVTPYFFTMSCSHSNYLTLYNVDWLAIANENKNNQQ
ncbi:mucin-2-like [Physella acuta]|uniref:mucin-2-like n=1 Tax=Physella acuta TaxID=109671 RepID=UPI0027DAC20F|nr:mucin-2-like [Physella acuta]